jgi:Zinc knuckle/Retroviral aspartyl protease
LAKVVERCRTLSAYRKVKHTFNSETSTKLYQNRNEQVCYTCKKPGHYSRNCFFAEKNKKQTVNGENSTPIVRKARDVQKIEVSDDEKVVSDMYESYNINEMDRKLTLPLLLANDDQASKQKEAGGKKEQRILKNMTIKIKNKKIIIPTLIDTGSQVSIIRCNQIKNVDRTQNVKLKGIGGGTEMGWKIKKKRLISITKDIR